MPAPWQLRDSNGPALAAALAALPFVHADSRRHAADDLERTTACLRDISAGADLIFVTGGVSMGDRDFVPPALRALEARTLFHKLPQRPGKPILAAQLPPPRGTLVLALPGNPVSVLVTARRLGVPVLRRLAGLTQPHDLPRLVTLQTPDASRSASGSTARCASSTHRPRPSFPTWAPATSWAPRRATASSRYRRRAQARAHGRSIHGAPD